MILLIWRAFRLLSIKPPGEGTGLGLSISHGILKNHGGRFWFESVEGEYTKIVVDLPVDNGWDKMYPPVFPLQYFGIGKSLQKLEPVRPVCPAMIELTV